MRAAPIITIRNESSARTGSPRGGLQGLLAGFVAIAAGLLSQAALAATLEDIKFTSLPGDRVQIALKLSEPMTSDPLSFTIDNPARIALDFPGTELKVPSKVQNIGVGKAQSVVAVEADGRTRVVVNLAQLVPYEVKTAGNTVTVTLEGNAANISADVVAGATTSPSRATAAPGAPAPASSAMTMPGSARNAQIRGVDFRRGAAGEAQIVVDLSDPNVGVNIQEQGGKILVDFAGTGLPEQFDRKLDVVDFATPAKEVDTFKHGNGTRMVVTPSNQNFEHLAYQSENVFTLELKPLTKQEQEAAKKEKFGYTGERLSLNFQNIEVRAVLQLIADFTGFNLVASDTVGGNVTLRLKNVPWDQAMDLILKTKGLGMRKTGNVVMVAPQEEIAQREKLELEAQKQLQELAPLRTEFLQINYAKASDIAALIKADANRLLSERGNVTVDARTNTLLIQDTAENLTEIRKIVTALDIPVRQVLIESRIVVASEDFSKDLGVKFGYSQNSNIKNLQLDANGEGGFNSVIGGAQAGDVKYPGTTTFHTDGKENYIVSLPVANPAGALKWSIGKIGSYLLQLELSALQSEGKGEIIASPHVITANQKEALIESGTEIPYQQATSSGATSVSFKKAVLSLKVTPHITPDDRIIMDLSVNRDAVGQIFAGVPSVDTNEVDTQVLVDNGETVVLGGIYSSSTRDAVNKVPFFGDLPYLNHLFKNTHTEAKKQELLVFVTPKILKETFTLSAR
ncbi:MAG: type IV pilus secretin PilQ [Gammaproteobacteria bacterium]|nr:type IV pilus secretin PilQ [Gammaproteobacteria bacterium]